MPIGLQAAPTTSADEPGLRRAVREHLDRERAEGGFEPAVDAWLTGIDPAFSRRLAARGWVGMRIPTSYGGGGRSAVERFVVTEELLAAGAPVAAHWVADRQMAPGILAHGTPEQRQTYLPGIATAELLFGIGMSEPDAGSDLAAVRTRAVAVEDGWRLTGTKVWTSSAHVATNLVVLVRTDVSQDRHGGLSQFVVDLPHPDIHVRPIITIDGGHHVNEVVFDDAVIPAGALLGRRGEGWAQVTRELAAERSGPERILSTLPLLVAWSACEESRGSRGAREDLGRLVSRLSTLRQMSLAIARQIDEGRDPSVEAALVKDLGTQFESEVVDVVRRHARIEPDPTGSGLARLLASAVLHTPVFTLRGGTNEVLRSIVAKQWST